MRASTRRCTGWSEEQAWARPFPGSDESGGHGEVTGCWALESEGRGSWGVAVGMELFSACGCVTLPSQMRVRYMRSAVSSV